MIQKSCKKQMISEFIEEVSYSYAIHILCNVQCSLGCEDLKKMQSDFVVGQSL